MLRKHFLFKGLVQGVGFRYRARYAAQKFGLSGWVRNRFDGSVEMEAQGETDALDNMIEYLRNEPFLEIDSIDEREISLVANESGVFEIRRY
ncbi:MAG: acylphosphatase [Proteobacteria bacterium]|nr:acylphosphatase [Pseudomonadota bacterium]